MTSPSIDKPVSSVNSRRAAVSGSSPAPSSPFGIDQPCSSLLAQNGPPGWTRKTSSPLRRRNSSRPAPSFGMTTLLPPPQQRQRCADQDARGSARAIRERVDDVGRPAGREGLQQFDQAAHGAEGDEQKEQAAPPPERQTAEDCQHEIGEQVLEL